MKPQTIGRTVGIGLRVAGRIAGQAIAGPAPAPQATAAAATPAAQASMGQSAGRMAAHTGRGVAQGVGGFFRPFRRVGGVVLLEVVGVFFLLPVVVFAPRLWQARASWMRGPDHHTFVASAIFVVVFLYLGITSFVRARRRAARR